MLEVMQQIWNNLAAMVPSLLTGLFIFVLFWTVALLLRTVLRRLAANRDPERQNILRLVQQVSYAGLLLLGLVTALGTIGVNVAALVTSLGLAGFALGFALKDALSNLISGVLLLLYRPFRVGDDVVLSGHEGRVASIDLRYTTLRVEGKTVFIPNSKLFTESVVLNDRESADDKGRAGSEVDIPPELPGE